MKKRAGVLLIGACSAVLLAGCGNVSQTTKKIELGENVTAMDLVKCKEGVSASFKDEKQLDIMKVGSYEVTFTIKEGDKTEDKTFTYEVVDTTAPEITSKEKIVLVKGAEFNIQKLVTASDMSGEVTITSSVDVDTKKPGDYPIVVTAKDASGNETTKDMTITVLNRTETNFRNAAWGDSMDMVRNLETAKEVAVDGSAVVFEDVLCGLNTQIFYNVDESYGLESAIYNITESYTVGSKYIEDYYTLRKELVAKYGEPTAAAEPKKLSFVADYGYNSTDPGAALQMGYIEYGAQWIMPDKNTKIVLLTRANVAFDISTSLGYFDTRYKEDNSGSF